MTFQTPYGKVTFDPKNGKTLLYLAGVPKAVSVHGPLKRLILTLAFEQARKFSLPYVSMN